MIALVTGATGLLGRHMVDHLLAEGLPVRALVRPSSATQHLQEQGVDLVFGGAGNKSAIRAAVQGVDLLFHAAAYLTVNAPFGVDDQSTDEWPIFKAVNVDFTEALLETALEMGVGRFIFVSSNSVYSKDVPIPTSEDAELKPMSQYGRSKLLAEEKVRAFQERGLAATIVRPAIIYGPGDRYFTPTALRLSRLPLLPLVNGGQNLIDLVHAADVARLLRCAALSPAANDRVYNAGSGRRLSLAGLVGAFRRITGRSPVILPVRQGIAERSAGLSRWLVKPFLPELEGVLTPEGIALSAIDTSLDMSRAAAELGYKPLIDLDQGLALTLKSQM